ncbi:MAG: hypothetical protein AAF975_09620, partial [Spirochaetota bacterium]
KLFSVADKKYFGIDPRYVSRVVAVYDSEGKGILFHYSGGIITARDTSSNAKQPSTADIQCLDLRLGKIITNEVAKAHIPYTDGLWDKTETDAYSNLSPKIQMSYKGSSVKDLVTQLLKNDLAYLVQKPDSRLTLRRVLGSYSLWSCPNWLLTKWPEKTYSDKKTFCSAISTEYHPVGGKPDRTLFDSSRENAIIEAFKVRKTAEFKSFSGLADTRRVSGERYKYYGTRRERWKVSLGADTSSITLLDRLQMEMVINGRKVSEYRFWRVLEIDTAQDILTLEQV